MTNAVCIMCGTRSGDAALLAEKIADRIAEKDAEIERLREENKTYRTELERLDPAGWRR